MELFYVALYFAIGVVMAGAAYKYGRHGNVEFLAVVTFFLWLPMAAFAVIALAAKTIAAFLPERQ